MLNLQVGSHPKTRVICNQFGALEVDENKSIFMPMGMIGIPNTNNLAMLSCPIEALSHCCILQSLQDDNISFIVLPLNIQSNPWINYEELTEVIIALGITLENAIVCLVLSKASKDIMTANARAPVFLDVKHQVGAQFVMPNSELSTHMPLPVGFCEARLKSHNP
jgi:flagellar assembly factor FliW